ncbi:MAG TPA: aminotransferase class I/II-fold pyridoxal phosphate-dependent enzyme [Acidobacteriota bacterium]|nr:aminotransferase class I/II-fold pyridoxal phosphate-dependent enzyme [Acidobacteriota bacterium]
MDQPAVVSHEQTDNILEQVARRAMVARSRVLLFQDFTEAMTSLLGHVNRLQDKLLVSGHAAPDLAIAVDRAELTLTELLGPSPFAGGPRPVLQNIARGDELVYVANPNRVTGASCALSGLRDIAEAIPNGTLVIDEHYYDYLGITAVPLLDLYSNVTVIRSFLTGPGSGCEESGFIVAPKDLIRHLRGSFERQRIPAAIRSGVMTMLADGAPQGERLKRLHSEMLRIATTLTRLGVQSRITATDFLLLRVADPKRVGNFLAAHRAPIENLDGYPGLNNYVRYRVQSERFDDGFLQAFKKMPREYYRIKTIDKRAVTYHGWEQGRSGSRGGTRLSDDPGSGRIPAKRETSRGAKE